MHKKRIIRIVFSIFIAAAAFVTLLSVLPEDGNSIAAEVDAEGWNYEDAAELVYYNTDTLSLRQLSLFVRADGGFAERNAPLTFEISTLSPDSLFVSETWTLYPERGGAEFLSKQYYDYEQPYRCNALLSKKGIYRFRVSHSEAEPIAGIWAVGINITK